MKWKTVLKVAGVIGASLIALPAVAWFPWVSSPQEPAYVLVESWGEPGAAPGQFDDPTGIAVHDGEVFVSDALNGRIQVFDTEGGFKRSFGEPGAAIGQLGRPMNLAVHNGALYVPEYFNDRVQVFSLAGEPLRIIGGPGDGPGQFSAPGGVAVADDGDLFVTDFYNQRVQRLGPDGRFVSQWGRTGETGIRAGRFNYPTDVAVARDGTVYIADGYNDRIQAFDPDGKFLRKWGGPFAMNIHGPFNGWFATVTSLAVGPEGHVFAADFYNDRVQKFRPDGVFVTAFGTAAAGPAQTAIAVDVDTDGTVYVVNYDAHRIEKWRPRE